MPRPVKNSDGQKATAKITLSVTPEMQSNIKILADITSGGNVNDLIVGVMDKILKKNSASIRKAAIALKGYHTKISKVRPDIDFDFLDSPPLAQDSKDDSQELKGGDLPDE